MSNRLVSAVANGPCAIKHDYGWFLAVDGLAHPWTTDPAKARRYATIMDADEIAKLLWEKKAILGGIPTAQVAPGYLDHCLFTVPRKIISPEERWRLGHAKAWQTARAADGTLVPLIRSEMIVANTQYPCQNAAA